MKRFLRRRTEQVTPQAATDGSSGLEPFLEDVSAKAKQPNADHNKGEYRTIRFIAKTGNTKIARTVWSSLEDMRSRGVKVVAVFTSLKSKKDEQGAVARYAEVFGDDAAHENVRVARFKRAKKLTEQAQFGEAAVWDEASDPVEAGALKVKRTRAGDPSLKAAKVSFEMVWAISDEVPAPKGRAADTKKRRG